MLIKKVTGINMKRGDIYYIDLGDYVGSEQGGIRPCVIISNDIGNVHSNILIVAPISTKLKQLPTHQIIVLKRFSVIMYEQIRTVDKSRVLDYMTHLNPYEIKLMDKKIKISLGQE